jgi:hypothetical protein
LCPLAEGAPPGDTRGRALAGVRIRLVRVDRHGAVGDGAGRARGVGLRAGDSAVGLRDAGRGGHGGGVVRPGRPESDAADPGGGTERCRPGARPGARVSRCRRIRRAARVTEPRPRLAPERPRR